jgi:hypothetical protein
MPFAEVVPIINLSVRGLCVKSYPLHPGGCPNFNCKVGCPPQAPKLQDYFDLRFPTYAIWNVFALGDHVRAMQDKHPDWSDRQLYCCLYWQPRARKDLDVEIQEFLKHGSRLLAAKTIVKCPEAMGLNVTATMKLLGFELEWPPRERAFQVALAGVLKDQGA